MKNVVYNNTMTSTIVLQIPTTLLQKYYKNATAILQDCRLQVTTGYYGYYSHYRLRGKAPWFADVPLYVVYAGPVHATEITTETGPNWTD